MQDIAPGGMPPHLDLLLQGMSFDFGGKYQKSRIYPGGAPCVMTLNYDLRERCAGLKEFPERWWLNENVIFVNIGRTPLWIRNEEEDRWYNAAEMEDNTFGGISSSPKRFKDLQKILYEGQRSAAERIWSWYRHNLLAKNKRYACKIIVKYLWKWYRIKILKKQKDNAGWIIWKYWSRYVFRKNRKNKN